MEGPFADDRTSVLLPSSCRVRGTWQGGRGGGTGGGVGVLRARRCHLRAGFQQCQSFVEMGTVRCCPLGRTVPCGLCPGCWCGGLHHQRSTSRAPLVSRPRRRPTRRRASPAPLSAQTVAGWLVWADILLDVIGGVESALREGCPRTLTGVSQHWFSGHFRQVFSTPMLYPALTLAPTCGANRAS